MKESSTYQAILEESEEQGRVEGLQLSLVALLEQKFGRISPALDARIRAATDPVKLQLALRQILTITAEDQLVV